MRNLSEIIESAKSGDKPDYEECYYAMLALSHLLTFDYLAIQRLASAEMKLEKEPLFGAIFQLKEHISRNKKAFEKSPKDWLGWNNDPADPDVQESRKLSLKIYDKFINHNE